jgi:hypothetical protein
MEQDLCVHCNEFLKFEDRKFWKKIFKHEANVGIMIEEKITNSRSNTLISLLNVI